MQQHHPESLSDHLANGRPWDLDRTYGGLLVLHPRLGEKGGFHQGTADALWRNSGLVREFDPDALVVVSADAVYRLDYAELVAGHRERDADLTVVTTQVDPADAGRYGVVRDLRRPGDRLRVQAGRAGLGPGGERGLRPPPGGGAGRAGRGGRGAGRGRRRGRRAGRPRRHPAAPAGRRGRGGRAPAGRLLAGRRHDRRVLGGPPGPARRAAAAGPGRPRLAGAHARRAAPAGPAAARLRGRGQPGRAGLRAARHGGALGARAGRAGGRGRDRPRLGAAGRHGGRGRGDGRAGGAGRAHPGRRRAPGSAGPAAGSPSPGGTPRSGRSPKWTPTESEVDGSGSAPGIVDLPSGRHVGFSVASGAPSSAAGPRWPACPARRRR